LKFGSLLELTPVQAMAVMAAMAPFREEIVEIMMYQWKNGRVP
jgi:hypothetical protein